MRKANESDGVTVWGSLQCPYYVHKALVHLFGLPEEKIRVVQTETGGGFGGKEEYPSMIAGHAALLAWKSGKPVKIIYDRAEDMVATTKRHPSRTSHRTAVTRDGKLIAMDIDFAIDGGAYETLSRVVLSRGTIHAAGPYSCPNVRIRSRAVATNVPPHGAFRGFGAPQSVFALERHLDRVAEVIGLVPDELRRRNFIQHGQTIAVGQVIREQVDMDRLMDRAFELSDYYAKRERFQAENSHSAIKRGMGFASFLHGAGFTGSGEEYLASEAAVEVNARRPRTRLGGQHGDGPGDEYDFRADCRRSAGPGVRPDRNHAARYRECSEQRPDRGLPYDHDRGKAGGIRRAARCKQMLLTSGLLKEGYSAKDFARRLPPLYRIIWPAEVVREI